MSIPKKSWISYKREARILKFITDFRARHGVSPTIEEMAKDQQVATSTMHFHVARLEAEGTVCRINKRMRSIYVPDGNGNEVDMLTESMQRVKMLEMIVRDALMMATGDAWPDSSLPPAMVERMENIL